MQCCLYVSRAGCLSINSALWKFNPTYVVVIIQVTDLMHAVGTAITPQIVRPFIGVTNVTPTDANGSYPLQSSGLLAVQVAYLVIGVFDMATAVLCLSMYCWLRNCCCQRRRQYALSAGDIFRQCDIEDDETQLLADTATGGLHGTATTTTVAKLNPRTRKAAGLLAVMSLFFLVNGGRDALLTGLLFTYVHQYCYWTVAAGTALVTVYHLTRVIVHAILVPVSRWVPPTTLTIVNLVVLTIGAVLTAASLHGGATQRGLFATGVIVTGIATSNVHPTAITVVEESIHVKASIMAILISSVGAGQIVFAPLAGWMMQTSGSTSYPVILVGLVIIGSVLFALWTVLLRRVTRDGERSSDTLGHGTSGSVGTSASSSTADGYRTRRRSASKAASKYDFDDDDDELYNSSQAKPSTFYSLNSVDDEF